MKGYIEGLGRDTPEEQSRRVSHLYKGDFNDPGWPMCARGWNRDNGTSYSIFRGNMSRAGTCSVCLRRATAGLPPTQPAREEGAK